MKLEGFHNRTGQWVVLVESDKSTWVATEFVLDFARGGNTHATLGGTSVNRTHFSAFRLTGVEDVADDVPF